MFGLMESDDEKLSDKEDELFEQIEVKARYEVSGLEGDQPTRPDLSKYRSQIPIMSTIYY